VTTGSRGAWLATARSRCGSSEYEAGSGTVGARLYGLGSWALGHF
jgi:hypothetical protein